MNFIYWLTLLNIYFSEPLLPSKGIEGKSIPATEYENLYKELKLTNIIGFEAFKKSMEGYAKYKPSKPIIAICDFTKPSNLERFCVIDLEHKSLIINSLVAHGKNSGGLIPTSFSNQPESLKTSLGFYNIGKIIQSPKHGEAILLNGLERGVNENARAREIIIHGAHYVCNSFIEKYGRLGRSFGCPALPIDVMIKIAPIIANGGLLNIYAENN